MAKHGKVAVGERVALSLNGQVPVPLRLESESMDQLAFISSMQVEVIETGNSGTERFRVTTKKYVHEVMRNDGGKWRRVIAWHFHPDDHDFQRCHCHLPRSTGVLADTELGKLHVPSGRVAVENVILFLIGEMNVKPARDGWQAQLEQTLARHEAHRSWA